MSEAAKPPVETPEPKTEVDKFREDMMASLGKVLTPEGNIQDAPPVVEAPEPPPERVKVQPTLGEQMEEEARRQKLAEAGTPVPDDEPPAPVKPVDPPVLEPPVMPPRTTLKKKVEPAAPVAPAVVPPPAAIVPPVAPVVVPPVVTPPVDPEAAYIATLDEDQQDELKRAAFAEAKFPEMKGKRAETLNFFKKVDEFQKAHPDATPEEADAVIKEHKPKWRAGEKRRVDTAYLTDNIVSTAVSQAVEATEKRLKPEIEAANQRIKLQEVAPVIDKAVKEFGTLVSSADSAPENMEVIPADVGKRIAEVGYDKALEEFSVEAPIFQSTSNAAREWLNITSGLVQYNPNNALHSWLLNFVEGQGKIYATNPDSVLNGKKFMPMLEHIQLLKTNPTEAAKAYTFNDQDVLNMLATNANIAYNSKLKALEKSGFTRTKKKTSAEVPNPPAAPAAATPVPAAPATASPRSKPSVSPGASTATPTPSQAASFIDQIVPGSSARLGIT